MKIYFNKRYNEKYELEYRAKKMENKIKKIKEKITKIKMLPSKNS